MKTKRFSRTLAILLALVMVLGMVPMWAAAAENAEIVQWNVTLRDNLQANFYLSIPETAVETATVNVCVGDAEAVTYNASELAKVDGYYCVSAYVAAAQMTEEIGVSVLIDGTESVSKSYTLAQYAATVLANAGMSKYHELVLNMLNYGANAQLYFDNNADNLANADHKLESVAAVPSEQKEIAIEGAVAGISFKGATLLFQDRIAIRYYFEAPNGVENYTFSVNEEACEVGTKGDLYYVQINGFNPQDYNNDVTLTVSDGAASQAITYSPMHYIIRMYNKDSTADTLKDLLAAVYAYHLAACNLPDLTPEELGYTRFTLKQLGIADGTQSGNVYDNIKPVENTLDMKYLDVDVSFGAFEGSTGIKYGASGTNAGWDGVKIGLTTDGNLSVNFTSTNFTAFTITPDEAGVESFGSLFNLKFATKVTAGDSEGLTNFTISMWINDALVLDHLLVGNMSGLGNYVGILTSGAGSVTFMSQETPEEMGYTRYTLADLGYNDGTYASYFASATELTGGIDGKYLDVDVSFDDIVDSANHAGLKIACTDNSWTGIRIGLNSDYNLIVRSTDGAGLDIFTVSTKEAGVNSFTETFNLKVATTINPINETWNNVTISLWINDKVIKKNIQTGGISGIGNYAGILSYNGAGITVATPIIEEAPEVTEPEATEPGVTEPEVTEPEVTEPVADPTPEELGYTRYTLEGMGIADGTYNTNAVTCAAPANGLNNAYLDVDVSFSGAADGSSGIKVANSAAGEWDGIRIGLADGDQLTVRYTVSDLELKTITPAEVGLTSFSETFNLKVATKLVDSATEGAKDLTLTVWINDKIVINHMLIGGVSGVGEYAGILSWGGASITVMSKQSAEEMGYTKITMADLGYSDGTYDGNLVRTAEVSGGMDGKYLDVNVAFGEVVDGSSGIKIGNTAAGSWDGLRIGLTAEGNLIVQSMAGAGLTVCTLTTEEAGVNSFTETFNLKFAVKYAPIDDTWTNVTINMWINDVQVKKNVTTGGISGMGNFTGMLTWNGASVTVATPA